MRLVLLFPHKECGSSRSPLLLEERPLNSFYLSRLVCIISYSGFISRSMSTILYENYQYLMLQKGPQQYGDFWWTKWIIMWAFLCCIKDIILLWIKTMIVSWIFSLLVFEQGNLAFLHFPYNFFFHSLTCPLQEWYVY